MAFSKMVGFEVTPRRSSALTCWPSVDVTPVGSAPIFCASSPESIKARRMLSYQMLCPSFSTSTNGFISFLGKYRANCLYAPDLAMGAYDNEVMGHES